MGRQRRERERQRQRDGGDVRLKQHKHHSSLPTVLITFIIIIFLLSGSAMHFCTVNGTILKEIWLNSSETRQGRQPHPHKQATSRTGMKSI